MISSKPTSRHTTRIMTSRFVPLLTLAFLSSCTTYRLHTADQAFDRMAYAKAARIYSRVVDKHAYRPAILRLAESYRLQNNIADAATCYLRADSTLRLTGDTALRLGQVLMGLQRMKEAEERFFSVLQERPEDATALDLYGSCQGYRSFYADSAKFVVNRIHLPGISTAFSAIPYKDGILVAGEREGKIGQTNPWNGRAFLDLYLSTSKTVVTWTEALPLPGKVNGDFHEGSAVLSADGRTIYFTRSNYLDRKLGKDATSTSHLKLFRATLDSTGKWGDVRSFAHNGEDFSTGHPALSADGRTLYFASDRPGGFGGSDIWRCHDDGSGWSRPENLGAIVNTPGNELFPTINGDALHFSSNAHENMGGLDIFETHEANGAWTDPRNIGAPINSSFDDFGFVIDTRATDATPGSYRGFLSSDRSGSDGVYTFWAYEPTFSVEGIVRDDAQRFLPNTSVTLVDLATGEDITVLTKEDGRFNFPLKANTDYQLQAHGDELLNQSRNLSTRGLTSSDTLEVDFSMTRITIDAPIAINNILYDYDKWDIRPDAARELDKLAALFKNNPHLTFELGAHTDSRGGDTYNLVLSDARANSAVNYLIQQGVDPNRISAMGFGETTLVNKCGNGVKCTEEDHQANRRTEFKVTGINLAHGTR